MWCMRLVNVFLGIKLLTAFIPLFCCSFHNLTNILILFIQILLLLLLWKFVILWNPLAPNLFFHLQTETVESLTFSALRFCDKIFSHLSGRIGISINNRIFRSTLFSPISSTYIIKIIGQTMANFIPLDPCHMHMLFGNLKTCLGSGISSTIFTTHSSKFILGQLLGLWPVWKLLTTFMFHGYATLPAHSSSNRFFQIL